MQSAFKLVRTTHRFLAASFFWPAFFSVPTQTEKEPAPNYDPLQKKMGRHMNSSACKLSASH